MHGNRYVYCPIEHAQHNDYLCIPRHIIHNVRHANDAKVLNHYISLTLLTIYDIKYLVFSYNLQFPLQEGVVMFAKMSTQTSVSKKLLARSVILIGMLSNGCVESQPPPPNGCAESQPPPPLGRYSECENCYVELMVEEKLTPEGVTFALLETRNLHSMRFDSHVPFRYSLGGDFYEDYVLIVYDRCDRVLQRYSISSARYILWDDFSDPERLRGGEIELPSGKFNIIIPNDPRIWRVAMHDRGIDRETGKRRNGRKQNIGVIGREIRCEKAIKRNN